MTPAQAIAQLRPFCQTEPQALAALRLDTLPADSKVVLVDSKACGHMPGVLMAVDVFSLSADRMAYGHGSVVFWDDGTALFSQETEMPTMLVQMMARHGASHPQGFKELGDEDTN